LHKPSHGNKNHYKQIVQASKIGVVEEISILISPTYCRN
jgi:hypothetical protein